MYSITEYGVQVTTEGNVPFIVWTGLSLEGARNVASTYGDTAKILIRYVQYSEWGNYYGTKGGHAGGNT